MASYRLTARRRSALRRAQLISARKRRGKKRFSGGRKLSRGQKKAIAVAVAGAIVSAGVYKYTSGRKRPVQKPPGGKVSKVPHDGRPQRTSYNDEPGWHPKRDKNSAAAQSSVVPRGVFGDQVTYSSVQHPMARAIMDEIQGKPIMGKGRNRTKKQAKRVVVSGVRPDYVKPESADG